MLGTKVIQVDLNDKGVALLAESVNGGSQQKIDCDVVLVAVEENLRQIILVWKSLV